MYLNIARLDPGTCDAGTGNYYVCNSTGFKGCCTVDPCGLSTCPDQESSNSSPVLTTVIVTAQLPSSTSNLSPATVTVFTERSSTQLSSSPTSLSAPTSSRESAGLAAATTSASTSTETTSPSPQPTSNHSALIAGVVVGIVVLAILSILGWFCLRRRQRSPDSRISSKSYDAPSISEDLTRGRPNNGKKETLHKSPSEIFASFEGHYKPQSQAAELPHRSEILERVEEEEDRVLPDIEKSRVKTPPVHEHPAYTPDGHGSYQPTMSSHPAYHVSHLTTHPAFRNVKVSCVPQTRSHQSIHTSYQISEPRTGHMDEVISPLISSPLISSPIAGHSELEAEVPVSYVSPILVNNPSRYSMLQQSTTSSKPRGHNAADVSVPSIADDLHTVSPSKRTHRVSLGVGVPTASSSAPNLPLPALPSTFVPASNSAWRNSSNTPPAHMRTNSRPFISTGEEIVSKIQRPTPRNSSNSLQNQPIISRLEPSNQDSQRSTTYSYAEEKEMGLSVQSSRSHPSQRWSDATMVTPAPIHRRNPISLSVPNLIAAARLAASPDPNTSGEQSSTPTSTYTEGTATWGSWAAR